LIVEQERVQAGRLQVLTLWMTSIARSEAGL